jgi:hypothetical protein
MKRGGDSSFRVGEAGSYYASVQNLSGAFVNTDTIVVKQKFILQKPLVSRNNEILYSTALNGNQWYLNGHKLPGENNQELNIASPGRYTVITSSNTCSSDPSDPYDYGVTIFPNPASNQIKVRIPSYAKEMKYRIIRSNGTEVKNGLLNRETVIGLPAFVSGLYFFEAVNGKGYKSIEKFWVK